MRFFDKIKDVTYVNSFKQLLHRGSSEILLGSVIKISTFNKDTFDSEWTLTTWRCMDICKTEV